MRIAPPYYNDKVYIESLASSTRVELSRLPFQPDVVLASFHGIPKEFVDKGDPYYTQCIETMRLLRDVLKYDDKKLMVSFQSRFGSGKWLEPATDKTVKKLAKSGVKNLAVITPGFSADCLETLEEIAVENARHLQEERRRELRGDPLPQRQRARHAGDLADGAARAQRLDLKPTAVIIRLWRFKIIGCSAATILTGLRGGLSLRHIRIGTARAQPPR